MVTVIHDGELEKRQHKGFQRLDVPTQYFSKTSSWKSQKNSVNKNPESKPQMSEINEASNFF